MLEKEFVAGIIRDEVNVNDVIERCKDTSCLNALLAEMLMLQSKLLDKVPPIVTFEPNAALKNYDTVESLSPETKRQLRMLDDAIAIVEAAMAERQEAASQDNRKIISTKHKGKPKETNFEDFILYQDTRKVMNALSELLKGKGGTDAAAIIFEMVEVGIIQRPTTELLISTFGLSFSDRRTFNTPYCAFDKVKTHKDIDFSAKQTRNLNKARKEISNFFTFD